VKPALRRPFGVSTNTRRRRCGIRLTTANGRGNGAADGRRLEINHRMEREPAPGEPGRLSGYVGGADYFPRGLVALLHRKNLSDANLRDPHWLFSFLRSSLPAGIRR
jgi:hypothetical protein